LPKVELTLLVGSYAQAYYLGKRSKGSLSDTVRAFAEYLPEFFPLPHPSPRNRLWLRQRPWFDTEVLPALRERVAPLLKRVR
jgi:uracil-DNA glycosylase